MEASSPSAGAPSSLPSISDFGLAMRTLPCLADAQEGIPVTQEESRISEIAQSRLQPAPTPSNANRPAFPLASSAPPSTSTIKKSLLSSLWTSVFPSLSSSTSSPPIARSLVPPHSVAGELQALTRRQTPGALSFSSSTSAAVSSTSVMERGPQKTTEFLMTEELMKGVLANFSKAVNDFHTAIEDVEIDVKVDDLNKEFKKLPDQLTYGLQKIIREGVERNSCNITVQANGSEIDLRQHLLPKEQFQAAFLASQQDGSTSVTVGKFSGVLQQTPMGGVLMAPQLGSTKASSAMEKIKNEFLESTNQLDFSKETLLEKGGNTSKVISEFENHFNKMNLTIFDELFGDLEGMKEMNEQEKQAFICFFGVSDFTNFTEEFKTKILPKDADAATNDLCTAINAPDLPVTVHLAKTDEGWSLSKTFYVRVVDAREEDVQMIPQQGHVAINVTYNLSRSDAIATIS